MLDPGNSIAWEIFEETATQVRTAGLGSVVGFDYSSLPLFFKAYEVPECDWWIMLKKLNVIYGTAISLWNKKDDSKSTPAPKSS